MSLSIGAVARATGVPAKTIRYYEEIGLIPPAARASNGYRQYSPRQTEILRFVKRAREHGFTVDEVGTLLALWRDDARQSADVRAVAEQHVAEIERKMRELEEMRRTLVNLMERCHGDDRPDCPILDDLANPGDEDV